MRYPRVLPSYKSLDTFRVVRVDADHYGVAHPGHAIPHGMGWIADCATMRDAPEHVEAYSVSSPTVDDMPIHWHADADGVLRTDGTPRPATF